jgi:pilus assembly protein CpaC
VLARPNLVAVSGETASFLAGGEFPIPVAQAGGTGASTVTIEFREFGVRLDFVAVALGDGRIRLQASPEVSDVDFSNAVQFGGFVVPGLTQRRVETTVELADGQSLAIAGLLDNRITANKSVVPLLGDIPVLGALFRSVRYQRRETELVVFVTPRLVSGMNPAEVPEVPGQRWSHPSEAELFFLGNIGRPAAETGEQGDGGPLFYGPYGFNRAAPEASD